LKGPDAHTLAVSGVRPGDVIAGKFRVERILGEGGMGYVVAATHLQLGQMVALKFMRPEICTPEYKSRFLREARNTVRLKSKHVSRVLDVGSLESGSPYMVMEYLEGTDLSNLLHTRGPLPVHEACDFVIQACEAIAEAHGYGIVHRDLKPANLFLTRGAGGEPVVKVLDFGVSKVLDLGMDDDTSPGGRPKRGHDPDSVVTKATDLLGSPSYMAPEQIASARDADARSDIWSLGVILFRLISGKAPFQGASLGEMIQQIMHAPIPNLRDARPDVPAGLENVVACCLERDRERRLADATELARRLAPYAGPVQTPSLERIAILGSALMPAAVPRSGSHPSNPPSPSNPSNGANAWTAPPPPPPAPAQKKEMSLVAAVGWGSLFVGAVLFGVLAVGWKMSGSTQAAPAPAVVPAASAPSVMTSAVVDPPSGAPVPTTDKPPVASASVAAVAAPSPKPAVPTPRPKPRPSAKPDNTKPPSGSDIPSTRE
jgi:serine/threonine-protein kinase